MAVDGIFALAVDAETAEEAKLALLELDRLQQMVTAGRTQADAEETTEEIRFEVAMFHPLRDLMEKLASGTFDTRHIYGIASMIAQGAGHEANRLRELEHPVERSAGELAVDNVYGPLAPAWRRGYQQGIADKASADEMNMLVYGHKVEPSRTGPYPTARQQLRAIAKNAGTALTAVGRDHDSYATETPAPLLVHFDADGQIKFATTWYWDSTGTPRDKFIAVADIVGDTDS
jgi:hypothetical protein